MWNTQKCPVLLDAMPLILLHYKHCIWPEVSAEVRTDVIAGKSLIPFQSLKIILKEKKGVLNLSVSGKTLLELKRFTNNKIVFKQYSKINVKRPK